MDAQQAELLGGIHALADSVQRDTGRYCHISVGHHPDGVVDVRVDICTSNPGEPYRFKRWDTSMDLLTITEVRDQLVEWIDNNRRDAA